MPNKKVKVKKVSVSFRTSSKIVQIMLEHIVADGYGLKGKSRWITDAVERFLEMPEYWDLVDIASVQEDLDKAVTCIIPVTVNEKLEKALIEVRQHFPSMEGVKSNILRASITQRVLQVK
ncbi:MAG: hypothetical protein ACE5FY_07025 [Nitrospiria bacterium]